MVYADTDDVLKMRKIFNKQKLSPEYRRFATDTPIVGIWDDHDYYDNDSDRLAPHKIQAQKEVLDFLGEPEDSLRRRRAGIYEYYKLSSDLGNIHLYLLDTRYHKSPWEESEGTILGEKQWQWLEAGLAETGSDGIHLIVSSLQVLPTDHRFERWDRFSKERTKLFRLMKKYRLNQPIILSGDRHIAEISHINQEDSGVNGGIWELTSSGMTHSYDSFTREDNRYRRGDVFSGLNFATLRFISDSKSVSLEIRDEKGRVREASSVQF